MYIYIYIICVYVCIVYIYYLHVYTDMPAWALQFPYPWNPQAFISDCSDCSLIASRLWPRSWPLLQPWALLCSGRCPSKSYKRSWWQHGRRAASEEKTFCGLRGLQYAGTSGHTHINWSEIFIKYIKESASIHATFAHAVPIPIHVLNMFSVHFRM